MILDRIIQTFFHGHFVTLFDFFVLVSTGEHSVVIGVAQLVEHDSANSPQVAILLVARTVVDFNAHVFLARKTVLDQPFFAGMVTAPPSPNGAASGSP